MVEISTKTITIATVLILVGIMIFSGFIYQPELENPEIYFEEAPIEKNMELQLEPGETYVYGYEMNDSHINITYQIMAGNNCTTIRLVESVEYSEVCLDNEGLDHTGSNSSFENPAILIFKPWMLALDQNWKWNTSMYINFGGTYEHISDIHYRVMRMEDYKGRMTFVVEIKSETGSAEYDWIDAEKRILLKTMGQGYTVELLEGSVLP